MRAGRLGQRESLADERADPSRDDVGEKLTGEVGAFARPDLKVPEAGDRYLPSAGVGRVDRREGTARRPVSGETAAVGHDLVGVPAELAADAVEYHRGAGPSGCVENRGRPARLAVIDDHVGPGLAHGLRLGLAPGGADDPRPACSQQLDEEDAHPAGAPRTRTRSPARTSTSRATRRAVGPSWMIATASSGSRPSGTPTVSSRLTAARSAYPPPAPPVWAITGRPSHPSSTPSPTEITSPPTPLPGT